MDAFEVHRRLISDYREFTLGSVDIRDPPHLGMWGGAEPGFNLSMQHRVLGVNVAAP